MRDGCCICFKTKWTLTINNLKCESYSWRSNFLKGICFGVHFHYVVIETKLSWKARSMREPALFRWHFGGLPFMEDVCKSLRPGNHPFKNHWHFQAGLIFTLMYALIYMYIFIFIIIPLTNSVFNRLRAFFFLPKCNWSILLWMRASIKFTMATNYCKNEYII